MANYRIDDWPPFGGLVVCGSVRTSGIQTLTVSVAHKYSTARESSCVPHVMTIEEY